MQLETKRLILREMADSDFDALKRILSDPDTMCFYPAPYDDRGVRRWIEWNKENYAAFGFGLFAMTLKDTGELIGDCGITMQPIDGWIRPEIGYHVNKAYQHMGYAREACRACRNYIFENTPFQTLYSYMTADNIPSKRTAASNGMCFIKEFTDSDKSLAYYAITRENWLSLPKEERC